MASVTSDVTSASGRFIAFTLILMPSPYSWLSSAEPAACKVDRRTVPAAMNLALPYELLKTHTLFILNGTKISYK